MAKPNLISVTFDDFSLNGQISFTQVGNYETLEFCCKRKEIATEKYTCFGIYNTTTKFGPEDLNKEETILEFGREYDCIVRSIGTSGKNPTESDAFTARTDLDIIKLESSHPMTISGFFLILSLAYVYICRSKLIWNFRLTKKIGKLLSYLITLICPVDRSEI